VTQGITSATEPRQSGAMPTSGNWGWYRDHEGVDRRRVSKLIKKVEGDTYNLDLWKLRQVAEGLAQRDDLVLAIKAMGRPPAEGWSKDEKKLINGIAETAMEVAKTGKGDGAKIGTAIHTLTERVDRGEDVEAVAAGLPAEAAQTIRAYEALRRLNGWRTVEIERTVVLDELEVAGTFDRIEVVPGLAALLGSGACQYGDECPDVGLPGHGDTVIADVKTEEQPWLNGLHIGPQLAIYSRARKMFIPTGGYHAVLGANGKIKQNNNGDDVMAPNGRYDRMPCVRQDVGIVVHLRNGAARPYFINLIEGWEAAVAAYEQTNREARAKRRLGAAGCWFAVVPNTVEPKPLQTFIETAVAADLANPYRPGPGLAAMGPVPERFAAPAPVAPQPAVPEYKVGDIVTVGGVEFIKHGEGGLLPPEPAEFVASRSADGTTYWVPADGSCYVLPNGDCVGVGPCPHTRTPEAPKPAAPAQGGGDLTALLIEAIWKAVTVDGLAILWNMARDRGVPWGAAVAMAATARQQQIECPQRALHGGGALKCACGWMPPVPA